MRISVDQEELLRREGFQVQNAGCVNRCVAGRTPREYEESCRQMTRRLNKEFNDWYARTKEHTKNKNKEYRDNIKKNQKSIMKDRDEREKFNILAKAQQQLIECEICKCQILCGKCLLVKHVSILTF